MLLVRPVEPSDAPSAEAHVRRAGLGESSARWAARALARPLTVLFTGLPAGVAQALAGAGEGPESDGRGPVVLTGGGEAALVSGSRWTLFSLATRLAEDPHEGVRAAAEALGRCLSRLSGPPAPLPLGPERLDFGGPTHVMGIVNVTPDSFSDGGRFLTEDAAVAHGERLAEAGAVLVDVGGESTRPGAEPVPLEEEIRRVVPVVRRLAGQGVAVSVDTFKPEVARAALEAGAVMVNDVTGLADPGMAAVVAEAGAALTVMHMRGTPRTMSAQTDYRDLVGEVLEGLAEAAGRAEEAGVSADRIVVDPGLGFAKNPDQNLVLLRRMDAFLALGRPVLVGPSRKSFIGHLTGAAPEDRLPGTLASIVLAARAGAHIVRVHDVAEAVQALAVADAVAAAGAEGEAFEAGTGEWRPGDPRVG